jgi:hypothetical protein
MAFCVALGAYLPQYFECALSNFQDILNAH